MSGSSPSVGCSTHSSAGRGCRASTTDIVSTDRSICTPTDRPNQNTPIRSMAHRSGIPTRSASRSVTASSRPSGRTECGKEAFCALKKKKLFLGLAHKNKNGPTNDHFLHLFGSRVATQPVVRPAEGDRGELKIYLYTGMNIRCTEKE